MADPIRLDPKDGLPAGHPPIAPTSPDDAEPVPFDDPSVPAGTIMVSTRGLDPEHRSKAEASLVEWQQGARDTSRRVRSKVSLDASGTARFANLTTDATTWYGVVVDYDGVSHASSAFRVEPRIGKRVPLRLYPVVNRLDPALWTARFVLYIEPRDHHVYVEHLFQFSNTSDRIWRVDPLPVRLPPNASAMTEGQRSGPLSMDFSTSQGPHNVAIKGLVPPGTTDVAFHYKLPYPGTSDLDITIGMPPQVTSLQASAALGAGLGFRVAGLASPSVARNELGQRLLVVEHTGTIAQEPLPSVSIRVSGLPGRPWSRYVAVGSTVLFMAVGVVCAAVGRRRALRANKLDDKLAERCGSSDDAGAKHRVDNLGETRGSTV